MERTFADYKVLPFRGTQGEVPGHELRRYHYSFMGQTNGIEKVAIEVFDRECNMPLEHVMHWTRWSEYNKRKWPHGGLVKAVLLVDGQRVHAECLFVPHRSDDSYGNAPIMCRDAFQIVMMGSREPLIEVVGVEEWMRKGTPMVDPWARDNAIFEARMNTTEAQRQAGLPKL